MIWIAAIVEAVIENWADFGILMGIQLLNATLGWSVIAIGFGGFPKHMFSKRLVIPFACADSRIALYWGLSKIMTTTGDGAGMRPQRQEMLWRL